MRNKCECPETSKVDAETLALLYSREERKGANHEPNACRGTVRLQKYARGGRTLWLCSCCNLPGDREL